MEHILEMAQVIMEPTRAEIIGSILGGPKYIGQIADDISIDRSNVAYHLSVLEQKNVVRSEYKILVEPKSKGTAARVYSINTELYIEALEGIEELLPKLRPAES